MKVVQYNRPEIDAVYAMFDLDSGIQFKLEAELDQLDLSQFHVLETKSRILHYTPFKGIDSVPIRPCITQGPDKTFYYYPKL